ncbi:hypothetical protein CHS0354_016041, partial [Potamilus streckersoni]
RKEVDIAYKYPLVMSYQGTTYIDVNRYLNRLSVMDAQMGFFASHDHAMTFTRHLLVNGSIANNGTK